MLREQRRVWPRGAQLSVGLRGARLDAHRLSCLLVGARRRAACDFGSSRLLALSLSAQRQAAGGALLCLETRSRVGAIVLVQAIGFV